MCLAKAGVLLILIPIIVGVVLISAAASFCTRLMDSTTPCITRNYIIECLDECVQTCSGFESLWIDLPTSKKVHVLHWKRATIRRNRSPLLCIPGTGSYSLCYVDIVLAQNTYDDIYVIDLPGWGISDSPSAIDIKHSKLHDIHVYYSQLIAELYLNIKERSRSTRVDILGHSLGAYLVIQFMKRNIKMIDGASITLFCTPGMTAKMSEYDWFWAWLIKFSIPERYMKQWNLWHCVRWWFAEHTDPLTRFHAIALFNPEGEGYDVLAKHMNITLDADWNISTRWEPVCIDELICVAKANDSVKLSIVWGDMDTLVCLKEDVLNALQKAGIKNHIVDMEHGISDEPYTVADVLTTAVK